MIKPQCLTVLMCGKESGFKFASSLMLLYLGIDTCMLLVSAAIASVLCELQDPDGLATVQVSTWKGALVLCV